MISADDIEEIKGYLRDNKEKGTESRSLAKFTPNHQVSNGKPVEGDRQPATQREEIMDDDQDDQNFSQDMLSPLP
jgi:hypothetical protein